MLLFHYCYVRGNIIGLAYHSEFLQHARSGSADTWEFDQCSDWPRTKQYRKVRNGFGRWYLSHSYKTFSSYPNEGWTFPRTIVCCSLTLPCVYLLAGIKMKCEMSASLSTECCMFVKEHIEQDNVTSIFLPFCYRIRRRETGQKFVMNWRGSESVKGILQAFMHLCKYLCRSSEDADLSFFSWAISPLVLNLNIFLKDKCSVWYTYL